MKKEFQANNKKIAKIKKYVRLLTPPILIVLINRWIEKREQSRLPIDYRTMPRGAHGLLKLIKHYQFETVLDVGSGGGQHAQLLNKTGKRVTTLDFGTSVYFKDYKQNHEIEHLNGDFYNTNFKSQFDCIWASHVLEHQPDPGIFIKRCMEIVKPNGIIAITVPPFKNQVVGGHLTLWNAGTLLYQLVFNGLNTREAAIYTYGYNITVIVKNKKRPHLHLAWDKGDIEILKPYLPSFIEEPFDGQIKKWNW